ncbi:MAG: DUF4112 domain-containing protein [Sphingomicrobium sp.]
MRINDSDRRPFPALSSDPQSVRTRVEALERAMENLIQVPGFNRGVGLDVLLDFVPVVGPTAAAVLGGYLAWEARNLGMPKSSVVRMAGNIGVDWALGMIPFIGAVPDFFFRSNSRNLKIIKRHLDKHHPATATINTTARPSGPPTGTLPR